MNNPNYDIFEIPPEEGGVEDDNYFGSIGDATQRHIHNLTDSQRQAWEDLYHSPDGSIFRTIPNWEQKDDDPLNLQGKELDKYFLELVEKGVSEKQLEKVKILLAEEAERREESKDIMDSGTSIPYHEWEKFPQMWNHYEIPATPKDRYIYMGNTRQNFYDVFPERHPDTDIINIFIHMINNDNIYEPDYRQSIANWLQQRRCRPYACAAMLRVLTGINEHKEPSLLIEKCLVYIDREYQNGYHLNAKKIAAKDGMLKLLYTNAEEWEKQYKAGNHVFSDILKFGKVLFKSFRNSMNAYHWHFYRRTRDKYAPAVIVSGFDINRCRLKQIQMALNTTDRTARDIWHARPFRNLAEVFNKGFVSARNFSNSEQTDRIIDWLEKCYQYSLATKNTNSLKRAANKMTQAEKDNKLDIQQDDWKKLWSFFNILKQNLLKELAENRGHNE